MTDFIGILDIIWSLGCIMKILLQEIKEAAKETIDRQGSWQTCEELHAYLHTSWTVQNKSAVRRLLQHPPCTEERTVALSSWRADTPDSATWMRSRMAATRGELHWQLSEEQWKLLFFLIRISILVSAHINFMKGLSMLFFKLSFTTNLW